MNAYDSPIVPRGWIKIKFAENQNEYETLNAVVSPDIERIVITEWLPTVEDLQKLMDGGRIRIQVKTFGTRLSPIAVDTVKDDSDGQFL